MNKREIKFRFRIRTENEEIIEIERKFDFELEGKIYKTNKGIKI